MNLRDPGGRTRRPEGVHLPAGSLKVRSIERAFNELLVGERDKVDTPECNEPALIKTLKLLPKCVEDGVPGIFNTMSNNNTP